MSVISMKTERLILRNLEHRDVPFYYERITSRPAVAKTMLWEPHSCVNETETVFQKILSRYEDSGYHRWAIALRNDDTVIGTAELLRFTEDGCCSFAYMIGEDFWNHGYATEALQAIFAYGFSQLGIKKIEADHFSCNPASGRVMQKLGMTHCGTHPAAYEKNGTVYDAEAYYLTKETFMALPEL